MKKNCAAVTEGTMGAIAGPVVIDEKKGVPTRRLIKDILLTGTYIHPKAGWEWMVGSDSLQKLAENGNKYLAAGGEIEVTVDHGAGAEDVIGYIVNLWVNGDRLMALFEFRGQRGIGIAECCQRVSIEVDPNFVDGKGTNWGEMLTAVSLVQKPVVSGQTDFIVASLKGLDKPRSVLLMSRQLPSSLNSEKPPMKILLPILCSLLETSTLPETEAELAAAVKDLGAKAKKKTEDALADMRKNCSILETKVSDLEKAATAGTISAERKEMLADSAAEAREQLDALNGKTVTMTPALIEKIAASLIPAGDNGRVLMLSRNGDKPAPSKDLIKALSAAATGAPTASRTGGQAPTEGVRKMSLTADEVKAEAEEQKRVTNEMLSLIPGAKQIA